MIVIRHLCMQMMVAGFYCEKYQAMSGDRVKG